MQTPSLREKLHSLIESSPEEKLIEVYSVFEDEYTDEFKAGLDEEYDDYENNGEIISKEKLDTAINNLLYESK